MAVGNMHKRLVKIGRVVPDMCSWTDKHETHIPGHYNTLPEYRRLSNKVQKTELILLSTLAALRG